MDGSPGFRQRPLWLLAVAAVAFGQAGVARDLFGPGGLTDPRPVVSGRHPLHLYHATLGAGTFRERYTASCYDPAFQAGYPKTPVFDGGSRPAELVLLLAGGGTDPTVAYKYGLLGVCVLAPVCFAAAARGAGLTPAGCAVAAAVGSVVWWTPPVRALLDAGHVDLLVAGLMGLVFVGGLIRYAADPGLTGWALMSAAAVLGWYAHPVVWLGLLPVFAVYLVAVSPRFGLAWHLGLVGVTAAGLAPNLWWLWDWGRFWWIRQPSVDELTPLPTWGALGGSPADAAGLVGPAPVSWAVAALGSLGLAALARDGRRVAAGTILLTAGWVWLVARLGATWPTLQAVHAERAAPAAVALLVAPAAYLLAKWWASAAAGPGAVLAAVALPVFLGWSGDLGDAGRIVLGMDARRLPLGFTAEQDAFARGLRSHTTPDARILLEDVDPPRPGWNWTALLATATDRVFLGGLDPDACVEHSFCGMRAGRLNGRPFADWTPAERDRFAARYNVGWVACRTPAAADFWRADPDAREVARFADDGEVVLFALDRPRTFVLAGAATVERIDRRSVVLTDVSPGPGNEVVLSLHHQPGFRAAPNIVGVDPDKDPYDPIPMLKLRLPGPVSRLTLTWENP